MNEKISLKERTAYGMSEFAGSLMWGMVGSYLLIFYTDVAHLSAAVVGTMFLLSRIWDAVNDIMMGMIVDRTKSKWGKCRPYFLWMCVPLATLLVLTFTAPDLGTTGKFVYAVVTYNMLNMLYTSVCIPINAILPRITNDADQRNILAAFRTVGAMLGNCLAGMITLQLVNSFGGGSAKSGYFRTALFFGTIVILLFLFVFRNIHERVEMDGMEAEKKEKLSLKDELLACKGNIPWLIATGFSFLFNLYTTMRGAGLVYYMTYYLGNEGLVVTVNMMGLLMILAMVVLPGLAQRFGRKNTMIVGTAITLAGHIIVAISGRNIPLLLVGTAIQSFFLGISSGLMYTLIADASDYATWTTGIRAEGFLSSACAFASKLGTGIGSAAGAWILALGGYVANANTQSSSALAAIRFNYTAVPVIVALLDILLLVFWNLDKLAPQMHEDIKAGRLRSQN